MKLKENVDLKVLEELGFRTFKRYLDDADKPFYRRDRKRFFYNEFVEVFDRHITFGISYSSKNLFKKRFEKRFKNQAPIKDLIEKGLVE